MKRFFIVLAYLTIINTNAFAVDPFLDWKTIESEHLYVHFADGNKSLAERAVVITEAAHERLTKELNWQPREKTHVVLSDETDLPNGFASPIFFNHTVLYLAPPTSINTLEDFDDWLSTLIVHEYTHIVHLDKSDGSPEYLRKIFGRFAFLFPNVFQPLWVIEGVATHKETDVHRGVGRGQSAMFDSMMRQEVANGLQPISHVNLPVNTWPAGTTRYLYGVYFMTFLAEIYGEDELQQWIEEYSNNLIPFFVNTAASQTFDRDLTSLWEEYQQWLIARFQPQIDTIEAMGIKVGIQISREAYRTNSVRAIEKDCIEKSDIEKDIIVKERCDEIYYVRDSGYKRATLMRVKEGKGEELVTLNGGANLDLHPQSGLLLTQDEFCNNYTVYKDIYRFDEKEGELKRLTECGRYIFASWHPDGKQIIAVHHEARRMALHLLDKQAKQQSVLWQADDEEVIGQIDVSPDGTSVVASVWRKGDGWNIESFNLSTKQWEKITSGSSIAAYPQYTAQGNILFSQEADGVYNLQRYTIGSETVEQLTNLIGGAFQSSQASENGSIYYSGYTAEGFAIFKLDENVTAIDVTATFSAQCSLVSDDRLEIIEHKVTDHQSEEYSALSNMYPRWWFPTFAFSEQRTEIGITTSGADVLGVQQYSVSASYDTNLEMPAGSLSYAYADRFYASGQWSNEITLDANSDIERISNRSVASAVVAFPNNYLQEQYNFLLAGVYDITKDGELSAGALPAPDFEDNILGVAGLYESADVHPLSISANDGMSVRLVAEDSDILNSDFTGQVYTLDWRQYVRTGRESVLALRFVQGWGSDDPNPFRLGGEGSNDNALDFLLGSGGQAVFDVREYPLRGYLEGHTELRGRRMQLLSSEWRFPIQRIEQGIMAPPIGIMQWFGDVFVEVGSAYHDSPETYYPSAGFELTADINIFYNVLLRTRLGYAHGFDDEIGDDQVYLKIGSSF